MTGVIRTLVLLALLVSVSCAPATPSGPQSGAPAAGETQAAKTITVAVGSGFNGFAPWDVRGGGSAAVEYTEIFAESLASNDAQGAPEPRLAARFPSLDDGSVSILPDGRMAARWELRPNVKWHDGRVLSADDVVFGWEVISHREVPTVRSAIVPEIDRIEATGPLTFTITWKRTYFKHLDIGFRDFWPLPRHLLLDAFQGDKEAFINLPFWNREPVNLGPYRLAGVEPGERATFERFDDYYRGRPLTKTVVFVTIDDGNTLFANLLGGAADATTALPGELVFRLRDDWQRSGEGRVFTSQSSWKFVSFQFSPEWGGPPELQRDARIRRGLYLGVDTDSLRQVLTPGFAATEPDSFMPAGDPRETVVGKPFARYRYDPTRAAQELADAGWRRAADGRMLNQAGLPVQLSLRTGRSSATEMTLVAQNWRELGIDMTEELIPGALERDNEYLAKFPNMEITAQGKGDSVLRRVDSRNRPTLENRFSGSNAGSYADAALDRLVDRLYGSISRPEQGQILKELHEMMAADLPLIGLRWNIATAAARKGVRALEDFAGAQGPGSNSRNAHLWDRD